MYDQEEKLNNFEKNDRAESSKCNDSDFETLLENVEGKINNVKYKSEPASENFKNRLKSQILEKRREKNTMKTNLVDVLVNVLRPKKLTPLVALLLILFIIVNVFPFGLDVNKDNPFSGFSKLMINSAYANDNFELIPSDSDTLGVESNSIYVLKSKEILDTDLIKDNLVLEPEFDYDLKKISDTEWQIIPQEALDPSTIVKISLATSYITESGQQKARDYSWAFQVKDSFKVVHSIPRDKGTSVPLNSGIEITFSHDNFTDYEKYFEISPVAEGSFEKHGRTLVFVPKSLSGGTIYTVTVKKGLPLDGSDEVLAEDYKIEFETVITKTNSSYKGTYFYIYNKFLEIGSNEKPIIQVSTNRDPGVEVKGTVYGYQTAESFLSVLQERDKLPWWSYSKDDFQVDLEGLNKILEFTTELKKDNNIEFIEFPSELDKGFYVFVLEEDNVKDYVWAQVSDLSAYLNITKTDSIFWVNDIVSQAPAQGVKIELINSNENYSTNSEGIAQFKTSQKIVDNQNNYDSNEKYYFKLSKGDNVLFVPASALSRGYWYYSNYSNSDDYWNYLYTDRPRYQSTDTIKYWGMLKSRDGQETKDQEITISLYKQGYVDYFYRPIKVVEQTIELTDYDTFLGEIKFEDLRPDYYTMELKIGDQVIKTKYIEVKPYTKPAYDLELTADRTTAFAGETIHLVGKASFFEGTPVPGLDLIYTTPKGDQKVTTNDKGEVYLEYTKDYYDSSSSYWPDYEYVSIRPDLSELAEITAGESLYFYGPNVYLDNDVSYPEKGVAEVKINSKFIDLEALNSSNWWDRTSGDDPAPNIKIVGELTKTTYNKVETGTRYDFINKRSYTTYRYERKTETLDSFEIKTDVNGEYVYKTNIEPETSYRLHLTAYDEDDRYINYSHYLYYYNGRNINYYGGYNYNYYHFELENKTYSVGDEVTVKFVNNEDPMPEGDNRFLYLQLQNGLQEYSVADDFEYKFNFEERDIPNVNLTGVYFNGHSYVTTYTSYWNAGVSYDKNDSNLKIYLETDQTRYEPGDDVNLSVRITDINDKPVSAEVNLNLVDEAYYAVVEDTADPLGQIYQKVSSGSFFSKTTHESITDEMSGAEKGGCFVAGTKILMADGSEKNIEDIRIGDKIKTFDNPIDLSLAEGTVQNIFEHIVGETLVINGNLQLTPEHVVYANGRFQEAGRLKIGDWMYNSQKEKVFVTSIEIKEEIIPVYNFTVDPQHTYFANDYYVHNEKGGGVRELFTDAAFFESVTTNSAGKASVQLTLPDNITSWRVTAQAISKSLEAGTNTTKIPVSLPVFEDITIGDEYLVADKPVVKLRAFGNQLNQDDQVEFTIKASSMGIEETDPLNTVAFDSTYFELSDLQAGQHDIVYKLETDKGSDAVKLPMEVVESRLEASVAKSEELITETKIESVDNKPVTVVLSDRGQNMLYNPLLRLSWAWGDRVDQILTRIEARKLLEKYYDYEISQPDFVASDYQLSSGGITLFPYSSEDLELSVKVASIGASDFDKESLSQYFFEILEDQASNQEEVSYALAGLASLHEPVLPRIYSWLERDDLSAKEKIYLAQALFDLGDQEKSRTIYYEIMNQYAQEKEPEIIIKVSENQDEVFQATALMSVLATSLNTDEAQGLWDYLNNNQILYGRNKNSENLFNLEKINYISHKLPNLKPGNVKITYELFGKKQEVEITGGRTYSFYLAASEVDQVKFLEIEGEAGVSTIYVEAIDLEDLSQDTDIQIKREYYVNGVKTNNFKENDTIEIRLYPSFGANALKDNYQITDVLPSGLMPVTNLYVRGQSYNCHYWYPYNTDGQKVKYRIYSSWKSDYCGGNYISYYARVKNIGEYKAEPALMQSFTNPDYVNYSETTNVTITR